MVKNTKRKNKGTKDKTKKRKAEYNQNEISKLI
jgi:hypothetical protein